MRQRASAYVISVTAVLTGSFSVAWLYHDITKMDGGRFDAFLHDLYDIRGFLSLLYLVSILGLIWHLSKRITIYRTYLVAAVWTSLGVVAFSLVALNDGVLQDLYNNSAYKRVTPDFFFFWLGPREQSDPDIVNILSNNKAFENYTWTRITVIELLSIVALSIGAAVALLLSSRKGPKTTMVAVPVTLILLLTIYCQMIAPWAYISDYDYFIGDRILGTIASDFFILFSDDTTGAITVYGYVVSLAVMVLIWRPSES